MKKIIFISIICLALLGLTYAYLVDEEISNYKKKGTSLIVKIEKYKKKYKSMPDSFPILNSGHYNYDGPYYSKLDSMNYKVYFIIGFDNQYVYYSNTKSWIWE
jgi:hypothetical protein